MKPTETTVARRLGLVAAVAILGLVTGAAMKGAFDLMYDNWTRIRWATPEAANTVPFWLFQGLMPILISAGWTALILRARSQRRWALLGSAAAIVQVILFMVGLIPIALSGNAGIRASGVAWPALVLVAIASPIVAAFLPRDGSARSVGWHVAAAIALPIAVLAGYSLLPGPLA